MNGKKATQLSQLILGFSQSFHNELLEQQTKMSPVEEVNNFETRITALESEIAKKKQDVSRSAVLLDAEVRLGILKQQYNELKLAHKAEHKINADDGVHGLAHNIFHGKKWVNEKKQERKRNEHISNAGDIENSLRSLEALVGLRALQQAEDINKQVQAAKSDFSIDENGNIIIGATGTGRNFNTENSGAAIDFKDLKSSKNFLDKGFGNTVSQTLTKYTNATPQQANLITVAAYIFLLYKGYQAAKNTLGQGSHLQTIALLLAGSWMATGMDPLTFATTFYQSGLPNKLKDGIDNIFDFNSNNFAQLPANKELLDIDNKHNFVKQIFEGVACLDNPKSYFGDDGKSVDMEKIYKDLQNDQKDEKAKDPSAIGLMALIEMYRAKYGAAAAAKFNDDYAGYISQIGGLNRAESDFTKVKAEFEKKSGDHKLNKEKEVKDKMKKEADEKLKKLGIKVKVTPDKEEKIAAMLSAYSLEDLNNPEKNREIKKNILKEIGIVEVAPDNSNESSFNAFLTSKKFNTIQYDWLNGQKTEFIKQFNEARNEFYTISGGGDIQLSSDDEFIYIESTFTDKTGDKKDRKIKLYPTQGNLHFLGANSALGAGDFKSLFLKAATMCQIIGSCEGKASISENANTPFFVNSMGKLDYHRDQTFFQNFNTTNIDPFVYDCVDRYFAGNIENLKTVLNGKVFLTQAVQTKTRDGDEKAGTKIEHASIWLKGIDINTLFTGIKSDEGVTHDVYGAGTSAIGDTRDYNAGDYVVDGANAVGGAVKKGAEAVAGAVTGAWDRAANGIKEIGKDMKKAFNIQPDNIGDPKSDYLMSYKDITSEVNKDGNTNPEITNKRVEDYLFAKVVTYKKFDEAFTYTYGQLQLAKRADHPEHAKYYGSVGGKDQIKISGIMSALETIQPGIDTTINGSFKNELISKGYTSPLTDKLYDKITRWYHNNCGDPTYSDNMIQKVQNLIKTTLDDTTTAGKELIQDARKKGGEVAKETVAAINKETHGMGGRIIGGVATLFGLKKATDFANGIPLLKNLIPGSAPK